MLIEHKSTPLQWGSLDLALFGLEKDWYGNELDTPAAFGMAIDHGSFCLSPHAENRPISTLKLDPVNLPQNSGNLTWLSFSSVTRNQVGISSSIWRPTVHGGVPNSPLLV